MNGGWPMITVLVIDCLRNQVIFCRRERHYLGPSGNPFCQSNFSLSRARSEHFISTSFQLESNAELMVFRAGAIPTWSCVVGENADSHMGLHDTKPNMEREIEVAELDGVSTDISSDDGMDDNSCEISRSKKSPIESVASTTSSWAGIVRNPNVRIGLGKLSYVPPTMVDGKKVITLSSADFVEKINSCKRMLVGSFVGKRLPYTYVKSVLKTLWKPKGDFEMITRGESLLIFKFALDEDRQTALEVGCTHIAGKLFIIKPWKPFIEQELADLNIEKGI